MGRRNESVTWLAGGTLLVLTAAAALAQVPAPPAPEPKSAPVSATPRPQLPPGQVFECVDHGQRIFSDAPCGAHAAIRQLNDLNVMDPPSARTTVGYRSYGPGYQPPVAEPSASENDDASPDVAGDSYATHILVVRERGRREHLPHHDKRPHARPQRH